MDAGTGLAARRGDQPTSTIIQCLPPVILSLLMQRRIVSGMTMGAVKQ
ncbi:MAG TPA: hypothetical protein VJ376_02610 [Pseudomonadota bacterium]|nr:hypothetical protein [Pseudomonadota bacterium]